MSSQTIAPTVRSALKTALAARTNLTGVQITYGSPWEPNADYIALGNVRHTQEAASIRGTSPRATEDTFEMELICSALRNSETDQQTSEERAYALAAEIEDEIRTDMTIAGSITNGWALVTGMELEQRGPDPKDQRESVVTVTVTVRARI